MHPLSPLYPRNLLCSPIKKPLNEIVKGEPHSLYVDGKPKNVNVSVFQEQKKQAKNSPSK